MFNEFVSRNIIEYLQTKLTKGYDCNYEEYKVIKKFIQKIAEDLNIEGEER